MRTLIASRYDEANIQSAGGLVISPDDGQPPILFTPRLGVYTYMPEARQLPRGLVSGGGTIRVSVLSAQYVAQQGCERE